MKLEKSVNYGSRQAVIQNLKDAGCTKEMIESFVARMDDEDMDELLISLEKHRCCLLHKVHERERQIDCLDYLVYQIKRTKKHGEKKGSIKNENNRKSNI